MKKLKVIGIILGILLFIVVVAGLLFSTLYEDKVKALIIEQINNSVNTKIDVKDVNFSVFKKFPYASLEFSEVTAEEMTLSQKKGELFNAESVFLQFNILDILNENYIIKKVQIEHGMVNLRINKDGSDNYHFWKPATNSSKTVAIEMEDLKFKEMNFYYLNEIKNIDFDIQAKRLTLSGNFSAAEYTLDTKAKLYVSKINSNGHQVLKDKTVYVNTSMDVNQKTKQYRIKSGAISLEELNFSLSGYFTILNEGLNIDIKTKGNDLSIEKLYSLFPEATRQKLEHYDAKGIISYTSTLKGILSSASTPSFDAEFSITDGSITEKSSDQSLEQLHVKGSFSNGNHQNSQTSKLVLNELSANFGAGKITGDYTITDFNNPYMVFKTKTNIGMAEAKAFFKWDSLEVAEGQLQLDLVYEGYIKELDNIKASELRNLNASGKAKISNGNLKQQDLPYVLSDLNGVFRFNNNDVMIDTLNFTNKGGHYEFEGKFKNLLSYLFIENEQLLIRSSLTSNKVVLEDFLSTEGSSEYQLQLPKDVVLQFRAKIDTFQFRKFFATDFNGLIELEDKVLTATNVKFNAMEGSINGNMAIDDSQADKILITSKADLNNIDVHQLFVQFENFGQTHILDKNIKGITTTHIEFASVWDKQLHVDKKKIYVLADIDITAGELIQYQPAMALSKYIEVEELEHIKFDRLTTQIEVKEQVVTIPKTDIVSSAIDLTISGTHTFNNEIDYRFKLLLNDVLWGKAKRNKKEITEFGYVADDGLGKTTIFLKMTGTVDNYKVVYDTQGLKENWRESIKKEKNTLKTILNNEFGWFKNDTTLKKDTKPEDDGFILEWEETEGDDDKKDASEENNSSKKKKKKGLSKFIDKIAQPDEEEYEEFDDF